MNRSGIRRGIGGGVAIIVAVGVVAGCGTTAGPATTITRAASAHTPAAQRIRSVLTSSLDAAIQPGAVAPPQLPILQDQYDACTNYTADEPPYTGHTRGPFSFTLDGFANATKVDESAEVGAPAVGIGMGNPPDEGLLAGGWSSTKFDGTSLECDTITAQLNYDGQREFPPLRATFLAFGVVPVTATAILSQTGPDPLTTVIINKASVAGSPFEAVATARMSLRLTDVSVNGAPLDVGAHCQTTEPLSSAQDPVPGETLPPGEVALVGGSGEAGDPQPAFTGAFDGGAVAGVVTIPSFTGCTGPGGDSLNALMTAAVAGPGNYVQVTTGVPCTDLNPACAGAPNPQLASEPAISPDWTVTGGGALTGTPTSGSSLVISEAGHTVVTCAGAGISMTVPNQAGPPRGAALGTVQITASDNCVGTVIRTGAPSGTWQVSETGQAQLAPLIYPSVGGTYDKGHLLIKVTGLTLHLTGTGVPGTADGSCSADLTGTSGLLYSQPGANPAGTLQWDTTAVSPLVFQVASSTCSGTPQLSPGFSVGGNITVTGDYNLTQANGKPASLTFTNPLLAG